MSSPESFAEWCDLFEEFGKGINDEENFHAACEGVYDPVPEAAEHFAEEFLNSVNERLKRAQSRFERDMNHAHGSESEVSRALLSLKRELKFIYKFTGIPCIQKIESLAGCGKMVIDAAEKIESSLISSAKNDRSGKLPVIVRNLKISDIGEDKI